MACIPTSRKYWRYLRTQPVKLTITSNGHSVAVLEDDELRAFHDIEFSLDYPTQAEQDAQRGSGNWELIHQQAERCVRLGVPVTIIAVMMKSNYMRLADVARVAKQFDAPLRVNVYQAVRSDIYALTYEEYWEGFQRLFAETDVIAIGEPLVRAMAGLPPLRAGCGVSTVRVTPRATTQPCVYWPGSGEPLSGLDLCRRRHSSSTPFEQARALPHACEPANFGSHAMVVVPDVDVCKERCWSRTTIARSFGANAQDSRSAWPLTAICPRLSSSCTTVVIAR